MKKDVNIAFSIMNKKTGQAHNSEIYIPVDKIDNMNSTKQEKFIRSQIVYAVDNLLSTENINELSEDAK